MLGGPRLAAKASRRVLRAGSAHCSSLETLLPTFLCPVIESGPPANPIRPTPGPSSSSSRAYASNTGAPANASVRSSRPVKRHTSSQLSTLHRSYSSQAASATVFEQTPSDHYSISPHSQIQIRHRDHHDVRQSAPSNRKPPGHSSNPFDWRRKFPSTKWRQEMDFNRYSPPLRRRKLPEDAPALYDDEIKASSAWHPETRWELSVPDDYPLRHELFLILDSLDDIAQSASDPECDGMLIETLRQARQLIWANRHRPLDHEQDRDVALYLAGKVAETYVKLDAEDSMDRLMTFLDYGVKEIGVLPLPCFHALAARAGIARRYDAVLKICQVAHAHHGGEPDAELLYLRLRALIGQSEDVDLTRYWDQFTQAGVAVPRKAFDLLLRTHVRRQDVAQVNQVLEAMTQHGFEVDARAWLTILRGIQSFRPTLAAMLRRDAKIVQSPTLDVVNRLLMLLSTDLDVDGALMVLRIFRIPSIDTKNDLAWTDKSSLITGPSPQPNAQTYAILTRMFGRLGRSDEALAFFRLTVSASNPDGLHSLRAASSHVMLAFLNAGHPICAMSFATNVLGVPFFRSAEGKETPSIDWKLPPSFQGLIKATTLHYRILLECASALMSPDLARKIVVHLLREGYEIDQEVLRGLSRLIFSTIDEDALEAIRVFRKLRPQSAKGGESERKQRLTSLSQQLQILGATDRIVLASQHPTDLNRSRANGTSHTQKYTSSSRKGATSTKDELRDWLIKDSSSLFGGLSPSQNAADDDHGLTQDLSRALSPEAYAMRIRVYAVVRRDYESAQKVYHSMIAHSVKPTMMHIAPLIEGLTAVGKLKEAQQLKRNAKEVTGLQPTLRIHTALIRAYVRAGDIRAARKEVQELTENGYEIDETISNIIEAAQSERGSFALVDRSLNERNSHSVATRFHALMRMRRYLAAQEMVQSALDSGMRSDKVLHDLVRRSVSYLQKEHGKAINAASASSSDEAQTSSRADESSSSSSSSASGMKSKSKAESNSSHVFELAQAANLAQINRDRVTKSMSLQSAVKRREMKEHRKKVVALILDFADGVLHEQAGRSTKHDSP